MRLNKDIDIEPNFVLVASILANLNTRDHDISKLVLQESILIVLHARTETRGTHN